MRPRPAPIWLGRGAVLAVALAALAGTGSAQPTPALTLGTHSTYGAYVADPAGFSLYLLRDRSGSRDNRGGRADDDRPGECEGGCLAVWPPYIVAPGSPAVGPGLDASLVGTVTRADGATQITYGGWPLYYYAGDGAAGDILGHDVDDAWGDWYLVSPEGEDVED